MWCLYVFWSRSRDTIAKISNRRIASSMIASTLDQKAKYNTNPANLIRATPRVNKLVIPLRLTVGSLNAPLLGTVVPEPSTAPPVTTAL